MRRNRELRIGLETRLRQALQIALVALHRFRSLGVSEEHDATPTQTREMQGRAPAAQWIVAAH